MVEITGQTVWSVAALALILIGLAGSVIPVLPGPFLIWLGALVWAWADGFTRIGWGALTVLGLLAVIAWGSDLFLSTVMSRRAGASWKAIVAAIVGGLAGASLLSFVPVLGTVLGAILGAIAGMWLIEYWDKGSAPAATSAVQAYISSLIVAALLEMTIAVVMVAIFAWQAFL
ncbi:MAG TPA: DUF456 domain-containing protein [Caldilineaceae bacterium]|nr:DUF456 domain-containing protein [Caldilineaceae bacterium]